jgi:hypothetical protein
LHLHNFGSIRILSQRTRFTTFLCRRRGFAAIFLIKMGCDCQKSGAGLAYATLPVAFVVVAAHMRLRAVPVIFFPCVEGLAVSFTEEFAVRSNNGLHVRTHVPRQNTFTSQRNNKKQRANHTIKLCDCTQPTKTAVFLFFLCLHKKIQSNGCQCSSDTSER